MNTNFNKESKIFVAGHRGLVGSTILNLLKEKGYQNLIFIDKEKLDLRRQKQVEDFFFNEKPEFVFIAAAKVGGILANKTYKAEFIYDNLAISLNLINSAFKNGVKKLINLGSSCIYPAEAPQPLKEEYLLSGKLEPSNEPYAIAKIAALKLCQFYNEQYGTNYLTLMPPNLYGLNDKYNLETAHFIAAIIRKFSLGKALQNDDFDYIRKDLKLNPIGFGLDEEINIDDKTSIIKILEKLGITKNYIKLWGSGKPRREFLAVEDLADAMLYFMENISFIDAGEIVNIGYEKDFTIEEIANILKHISDYKGELFFDKTFPDGVFQKKLDTTKAEKLGWKSKINFEDGLQRLYLFYETKRRNYDNERNS
ncbi:MAG: GDP-L-fucose synthase [Candidatus Kapabacteria bacterium]|nr:GDP-L-fucose synthase [Candidatus Kapabacteria bacterium]